MKKNIPRYVSFSQWFSRWNQNGLAATARLKIIRGIQIQRKCRPVSP